MPSFPFRWSHLTCHSIVSGVVDKAFFNHTPFLFQKMDLIGTHFGLLTSTAIAFQSSKALYQQLSSFRNDGRNVQRLKEEVKAVNDVLGSLHHTLDQNKLDLSDLELPVRRCGMACQEFAKIIEKRNAQPSFRDWFKISYKGMDVAGFTSLVAGYKATIIIALGDANL